jgi:hypothetical protein
MLKLTIILLFSLKLIANEYTYIDNNSYLQYNTGYIKNPNIQNEFFLNEKNYINYNSTLKNKSSYGYNTNRKALKIENNKNKLYKYIFLKN